MGFPPPYPPGGSGDATSLDGVTVDAAAPAVQDVLGFDGAKWINVGAEDLIPEGGISGAMLAAGAALQNVGAGGVTDAYLGAGSVVETKIGLAAVTESKLGGSAVTAAKIATNTIVGTRIDGGNTFLVNLAMQGRVGAGACVLTGAKIGDEVKVAAFAYGVPPGTAPGFELTITVNDQLQQSAGIDSSLAFFSVQLLKKS